MVHPLLITSLASTQRRNYDAMLRLRDKDVMGLRQSFGAYNIFFLLFYSFPKDVFSSAFRAHAGKLFLNPFTTGRATKPKSWFMDIASMDNPWAMRYYRAGGMFGLVSGSYLEGQGIDFQTANNPGLFSRYMDIIRKIEAAPRIARFKHLVEEEGLSPDDARMMADNASGNYHLRGVSDHSPAPGGWLHATVSSSVTLIDIAKDRRRRYRYFVGIIFRGVMLVGGLFVLLELWNSMF